MSVMKTILRTIFLTATLIGVGTMTLSQQSFAGDPLRFFASCAGRLSAEMEFQWMFDGAASEAVEAERDSVLDILDAIMPRDQGRSVLNWRIEAKMAQAALLTRAVFGTDERVQHRARLMAKRNLETCRAQLLS